MAGEIKLGHRTGVVCYVVVQNASGQYWRTDSSAFETFNASNWTLYAITLTETGVTGSFLGNFPAAAAGIYRIEARQRVGGSPAVGDTILADQRINWSGTAEVVEASAAAIADQVWDETLSQHVTAGSTGAALNTAGTPASPTLCRVSGVAYLNGTPVQGRTVRATLLSPPQTTGSTVLEVSTVTTRSGSDGAWYLDLVQSKSYRIQIPEAGLDRNISVPAVGSATLVSLLT